MSKEYVDVVIIVPLEEEASVVFSFFPPSKTLEMDNFLVSEVRLADTNLTGLVVQLSDQGNQEAYQATRTILGNYRVGLVVCIGIAGRISPDLQLGDVCYTGTVNQTRVMT
jgi:nucleoside phosphorylase